MTTETPAENRPRAYRIEAVDLARGLATILMVQWHAYDAWAHPAVRKTAVERYMSLIAGVPLASFLVLAGVSVALQAQRAGDAGRPAAALRRALARRGLLLVLGGYVTNVAYAMLEPTFRARTLLRADVLHVIGWSLVVVACICVVRRSESDPAPDTQRMMYRAISVMAVAAFASPVITPASRTITGPVAYLVAPFLEVPPITRFPVVPLVVWCCAGVVLACAVPRIAFLRPAAARTGLAAVAIGIGAWYLGEHLVRWCVLFLGGTVSRAHPAVWFNLMAGTGRAILLLGLGVLLADRASSFIRGPLLLFGRGSLTTYVVHLPFAYGKLGRRFADRLELFWIEVGVVGLLLLCALVIRVRDGLPPLRRATRA